MANLWAKHFNTHVIRWKREINYNSWQGQPRSEPALQEAGQNCFYETFVPRAPAYLTYNINIQNKLANGTLVWLDSLAFDDPNDKMYLDELIASTLVGEVIDLPQPPSAINVEIFADFPDDNQDLLNKKAYERSQWKHGSVVLDGRIVIPIDQKTVKCHTQSIRPSRSLIFPLSWDSASLFPRPKEGPFIN
jgi:hypothetical protein